MKERYNPTRTIQGIMLCMIILGILVILLAINTWF